MRKPASGGKAASGAHSFVTWFGGSCRPVAAKRAVARSLHVVLKIQFSYIQFHRTLMVKMGERGKGSRLRFLLFQRTVSLQRRAR